MAKGPHLTTAMEDMLTQIFCDDRSITPAKARKLLRKRMRDVGLDALFAPDFPGVSAVSKRLRKLRERYEQLSPVAKCLDRPWSIFTLGHYPVPPEAIPVVLKEYGRLLSSQRIPPPHITIRQAGWIGRLSATKSFERWPDLYMLVSLAEELLQLYAGPALSAEKILEELGTHHEFALIDQALAALEAGDDGRASILYRACKSWVYYGYDQIQDEKYGEHRQGGDER